MVIKEGLSPKYKFYSPIPPAQAYFSTIFPSPVSGGGDRGMDSYALFINERLFGQPLLD
jgi:hypothetical protein